MIKLAVQQLHDNLSAWVEFPNKDKMQQLSQLANVYEPTVTDVIGFMDGVSFTSKCTSEKIQRNVFYCGYDCHTRVNNVFAYGPDGKVFFYAINFPGSCGGGTLTSLFLPHILKRFGSYKICVDKGFPRSGPAWNVLVGAVNQQATQQLHHHMLDYMLRVNSISTSLHQASKWGMHGMQGFSPHVQNTFPQTVGSKGLFCNQLSSFIIIGLKLYDQIKTRSRV
jgi:hypothetical protein